MKPQNFMHELNRLCDYHNGECKERHCPLDKIGCYINGKTGDKKFAEIYNEVEKWSDAHQIKTRQSEFLKIFPKAKIAYNEALCIAPCRIFPDMENKKVCRYGEHCDDCKKNFWLAPINESEDTE